MGESSLSNLMVLGSVRSMIRIFMLPTAPALIEMESLSNERLSICSAGSLSFTFSKLLRLLKALYTVV